MTVNMHEAKTKLSQLVAKVEAGEEVIISRAGKPVAKLTRVQPKQRAKFGFAKGSAKIIGDFDAPMPDEWLDMFYNAPLCTNDDRYDRAIDGKKTLKKRHPPRRAS